MSFKAYVNGIDKSPYMKAFALDWSAIVNEILAIFQSCKKPTPPAGPGGLPAKLVKREMERIRKGKDAGCPDRFREAFSKNGCKNKTTQDRAWCGLMSYTANAPSDLEFAN